MDAKTKGAWVVHHMNKLQQVTQAAEYENIAVAGKIGTLLSALSTSETSRLTTAQVKSLAKAAGISTALELPALLNQLEGRKLIDQGAGAVEVLGVTTSSVLNHTGDAFDSLNPTPVEQAAIEFAEKASISPIDTSAAIEYVGDTHKLATTEVAELLIQSEEIGFVDSEEIGAGKKLYFNGNVFRRGSANKINAVLGSLTEEDQRKTREMEDLLRKTGCMTVAQAEILLGEELFKKLNSIGMYDVSQVSNEAESIMYVTRPAAFGKFGDPFTDDALDLAKALVACLTYGMTRSAQSRGRIMMLHALLGKLIRGGSVGPATAIGQDYKVLELKRVVEITNHSGQMFSMRLLKRDIGEIALNVLTEGDASSMSLPNFGAAITRYKAPEDNRVVTRKRQTNLSKKGTREILLSLRTGS